MSNKTPEGAWGNTHLGKLLGTTNVMIGRYLNGLSYPTLQMMQKFERVFGWPVVEQAPLIPWYWEWPEQNRIGTPQAPATDLRYAIKLDQIIREWGAANPRTQDVHSITQHPAIPHKRMQPRDR